MLQCVAVCCILLQCIAVCCSVLQCVAVCCSVSFGATSSNRAQTLAFLLLCNTPQLFATIQYNTLQQTATHVPLAATASNRALSVHRNTLQQYKATTTCKHTATNCNEPQHTYLLQRQHQIVRCHLRFFFLLNCICSQRPAVRRHVAIDAVYSNIRRHFRISFRFHLRIFFSAARQRKRGSRPYYSVLQCVAVCCSVLYILKCQRANTSFI